MRKKIFSQLQKGLIDSWTLFCTISVIAISFTKNVFNDPVSVRERWIQSDVYISKINTCIFLNYKCNLGNISHFRSKHQCKSSWTFDRRKCDKNQLEISLKSGNRSCRRPSCSSRKLCQNPTSQNASLGGKCPLY